MELRLPWIIPLVGVSVVVGILRGSFTRFKQSRHRWLLRASGTILSVPVALVSLIPLLMIGCESHGPLIGSPDRRHVARVLVTDGPLGAINQPLASAAVRRSWTPAWKSAYVGFGFPGNATTMEPKVKWLDNLHLLISYPAGGEQPAFCRESMGQVVVRCEVEARVSSGTEE